MRSRSRGCLVGEDSGGELEAGERRTELGGHVAEEPFLAVLLGLEPGGHPVDRFAEVPELVAAAGVDAGVEPALGDATGGGGEVAQGAGDPAHEG